MSDTATPPTTEQGITPQTLPAEPESATCARAPVTEAEMLAAVFARIADGAPAGRACREVGMAPATFWRRMAADLAYREAYLRATEDRADALIEEAHEISDEDPRLVEVKDRDGNVVEFRADPTWVAWQKQRIDMRKWAAGRMKPKRYGDRLELDAKVAVAPPVLNLLLVGAPPPGPDVIDLKALSDNNGGDDGSSSGGAAAPE